MYISIASLLMEEVAKSHMIKLQLKSSNIDHIKSIIRTAPPHVEAAYRWPFEGTIAKFVSKDIKEDLARHFRTILDGSGINLKEIIYWESWGFDHQ